MISPPPLRGRGWFSGGDQRAEGTETPDPRPRPTPSPTRGKRTWGGNAPPHTPTRKGPNDSARFTTTPNTRKGRPPHRGPDYQPDPRGDVEGETPSPEGVIRKCRNASLNRNIRRLPPRESETTHDQGNPPFHLLRTQRTPRDHHGRTLTRSQANKPEPFPRINKRRG